MTFDHAAAARAAEIDLSVPERDYALGPDGSLWPEQPVPGADVKLLVGFKQSLGAYSLIKCVTSAHNPRHIHHYDDESAYLLEGELSVVVGDKNYDLEPGGFVFMPRRVPHQFIPHGRCVVLNVQAPGGIMDSMLEEIAGRTLGDEDYRALQNKYGINADFRQRSPG